MTAYATSEELASWLGSSVVTATATATLDAEAGEVAALAIGSGGGYGYLTSPAVVIAAPDTGTRATATATVANGVVTALIVTGGGEGYAEAPEVTIAAPVDYDRLLRHASALIDEYTRTARYDVDDDALPTDENVIAALRDATCAQAEFWLASDEEDDILGPLQSLAIGNVQAFTGEGVNRVSPMYLAPRAARILRNAGLIPNEPILP